MDIKNLLEKIYTLFIETDVLVKSSQISDEIKEFIEKGEYEKAMRLLIYILIFEMNHNSICNKIIHKKINDYITILYKIDIFGPNDPNVIEKFIDLIVRFYLYSLEHKMDLRLNNEKRELIKARLIELANIIQWER